MLLSLLKFGRDASVSKFVDIMLLDELSLDIYSEDDSFFMIQAADGFVNNYHMPARFHANYVDRQSWSFPDELYVSHLGHNRKKITTFVLFLGTKIHQTQIFSLLNMYLFINSRRPLDGEAKKKYIGGKSRDTTKKPFIESGTSI